MLIIISPAKTMDFAGASEDKSGEFTMSDGTKKLLAELQKMGLSNLQNILETSEKLSQLNFDRFKEFNKLPTKPAIFSYDGDVYSNIQRESLNKGDVEFLNDHLRIISGFYGVLKPLDPIKAYRLEMKSKLPQNAPKGLHLFWKEEITTRLRDEMEKNNYSHIVNLASNEYSAAIDRAKLQKPVIDISFLEYRNAQLKNIAVNAKRARGMMVHYIAKNHITTPEKLKKFSESGYEFNAEKSTNTEFVFVRSCLSSL